MRRSRLMPLSGLFFNTGDRQEKTVDESLTYSRHYTDSINESMMEGDRLEHKHAEEQKKQMQNLTRTTWCNRDALMTATRI